MFQVLFPEGQLECAHYERSEFGIELYNTDGEQFAFVPYTNLHAVLDDETMPEEDAEPSVV